MVTAIATCFDLWVIKFVFYEHYDTATTLTQLVPVILPNKLRVACMKYKQPAWR